VPLYLTEAEVDALLGPAEARAAVAASFERLARGAVENRPRQRVPLEDGVFAVMHAVDTELGLAGLKSYAWLPNGTPFLVVLFSLADARVEAVVEAGRLGELRTAAASAVAATLLARPGARTLGVIGCGRQAAAHVAALREALPGLEEVVAFCRDEERLDAFCERHDAVAAETHREAGAQDVVVAATTSRDPVLRGDWLQPGALVLAIGANDPAARELDNGVLDRASLVCVDSLEEARLEAGDLIEPVAQGRLDWLEVHELQQVVAGELPGRQSDDDVVVFKSNGLAAWDLAAAAAAVDLARERGAGREL
jgi:ornithine cyclodeaminase/alanine dehydrogenase-like protein (mu-crystallin family)